MAKPIIVFDLDGTLVDTAPDLLLSLNHCLTISGLKEADSVALRGFVGMGGRVMIERAFAAQRRTFGDGELDRLVDVFLEHYGDNLPGISQPYPGVLDALQRFEDAGFSAAICTNKFETLSHGLIEGLGLTSRFSAICGADTFTFRKPDPRHLLETITRAGATRDSAIMVGDSRTDIDTAKAAGIPVVAVDFGYTDRHVREFEPSHIISHFDELTVELAQKLMRAAAA